MENPNVISTILDKEKNIRYDILAYRKLDYAEKVQAVGAFYNQRKRPKVKSGTTITILTTIGFDY